MAFEVKVILDSLAPCGKRLTTITATYPRFIHAEVLTHRDRARNSASSRAIPWAKMRQAIVDDPVIPLAFGSEQKGMQTGGEVDDPEAAKGSWLSARDDALIYADRLHFLGVHKSIVNRVVEPWMWITVVMTATEWKNFFRLRCHPDAEIHFQKIAGMMRDAIEGSIPAELNADQWHRPFVDNMPDTEFVYAWVDDTFATEHRDRALNSISAARCARVSYLTHDGEHDPAKDLNLFDRLANGSGFGHWSPMEHVAQACDFSGPVGSSARSGPFIGWKQFRKEFPLENSAG